MDIWMVNASNVDPVTAIGVDLGTGSCAGPGRRSGSRDFFSVRAFPVHGAGLRRPRPALAKPDGFSKRPALGSRRRETLVLTWSISPAVCRDLGAGKQ